MTTKLHDLAKLTLTIKRDAKAARELREQARATSHDERHYLKEEAKGYAHGTRYRLLALGYLRGLSIRQMESPYTRDLASAASIGIYAQPAFRGLVSETPDERKAAWKEFYTHIEDDVKTWNNECRLRVLQRDALRASKEVA